MTVKKHVCHLTSVHHPADTRIFRKECTSLNDAGFRVTLIAASAATPEAADFAVVNVGAERGRARRMTVVAHRVYREAVRQDADLYHIHDPELLPWGMLLRLRGKQVIFDAHEDISKQVYSKHWLPGWMKGLVSRTVWLLEFLLVRHFTACVAATPAIAKSLAHSKVVVVQNFPLREELRPPEEVSRNQREIVFVGALTEARCAREIVAAAGIASKVGVVRLHVIGEIVPTTLLQELQSSSAWEHVTHHGWCDRETVSRIMARCSAGLVVFKAHPNHVNAQPNKLFEYMSAKLPVIASDFHLWREIVEGANAGVLVDPDDPEDIARAINRVLGNPELANAMGENGRRAVDEEFNWEREKYKLIELYKDLLK